MTSNRDIVYDHLVAALLNCAEAHLIRPSELLALRADIDDLLDDVVERPATEKELQWLLDRYNEVKDTSNDE